MLRLKSIEINGFRAIERAHVALDPHLTVLVGDNASGKTAILDAIAVALSPVIYGRSPRRQPITANDFRIYGLTDTLSDIRREEYIYIKVEEYHGEGWDCHFHIEETPTDPVITSGTSARTRYFVREIMKDRDFVAPVIASYGADRASPARRPPNLALYSKNRIGSASRTGAYNGALESRAVYEDAVEWFEALDNLELRNNRESKSGYKDRRLDAVRNAVSTLVPQLSNMRMVGLPPRLMVDVELPGRPPESLSAEQLSGGYRVMLALVMDLARRMVDLNPDLPNPLGAEGVVLIDEIDLHLHPRWQQLVVEGLRKTFPNVQFIMTTHSPQVLTTVKPENILNLTWSNGHLVRRDVPSTSGAESGRLMSEVMGVEERPPANVSSFVRLLEAYRELVGEGQWEAPEATRLLDSLRDVSPDDPVLGALDLERRRLAAQKRRVTGEA
ncbi:AAA family ATPase [Methylobacterium fujisawaense]